MMKKTIGAIILTLAGSCAFAVESNVAKEDLTPPPLEGALTASQIPPILTQKTNSTDKASQPSTAPATTAAPQTAN